MLSLEEIFTQHIPKRCISHVYATFGLNLNYSTDHIRKQWQIDMEMKMDIHNGKHT